MMDRTKAHALASAHMQRWGLVALGWRFAFNNRKRALGLCSPKTRTIFLSTYFLDKVSEVETQDTILHEIAHALEFVRYGTSGHGPVWKKICLEVGAKPVAKCSATVHHTYPYVIQFEGRTYKGLWKLPHNIHERLKTMALKGRPETRGQFKLCRVTYTKEA